MIRCIFFQYKSKNRKIVYANFDIVNQKFQDTSLGRNIPDILILLIFIDSVKNVFIVAKEKAPYPIKALNRLLINFLRMA